MKITVLCGGIGAAKLLQGFSAIVCDSPDLEVTAIINTADDDFFYGYHVCPDIDSILYHLSELHDEKRGWGRRIETFNFVDTLKELGQDAWFNLGDRDLALNKIRTDLLSNGQTLTQATKLLCKTLNITSIEVLPMCDEKVSTQITTNNNEVLSMQEYFVKFKCKKVISEIEYVGSPTSSNELVHNHLIEADQIIIAPSNPYLSILPILSINTIDTIIRDNRHKVTAISPIVNSKAVKGPLAEIMSNFSLGVNQKSIAQLYESYISTLIIDESDSDEINELEVGNLLVKPFDTMMVDADSKMKLASFLIEAVK